MRKFRESEKQFVHPKPIYDDGKYKLFEIKSWQDMQSVGQDIPDCEWYELSSYHREKDFKSSLGHTIDGKFYVVETFKGPECTGGYLVKFNLGELVCDDKCNSKSLGKLLKAPKELLELIKVNNGKSLFLGESLCDVMKVASTLLEASPKKTNIVNIVRNIASSYPSDIDVYIQQVLALPENFIKKNCCEKKGIFLCRGTKVIGAIASPEEYFTEDKYVLEIPEGITDVVAFSSSEYWWKHYVGNRAPVDLICPSTLKRILGNSFKEIDFNEIVLNEGLEKISKAAFEGAKIKKLTIPSTLKDASFYHAKIDVLRFPKVLETIPSECFKACKLHKIHWPRQCDTIAQQAFASAEFENFSELPDSIKRIEDRAFEFAELGPVFELPEGLEYIGNEAFKYAEVEHLTIKDNVTFIGNEAFCEIKNLESITLPDNTETKYGKAIVQECPNLKTAEHYETLLSQRSAAFRNTQVKVKSVSRLIKDMKNADIEVFDEPSAEKFGAGCFESNKKLKKVIFGENLKVIGDNAFRNSSLEEVDFSRVKNPIFIGADAFDSTNITKVILPQGAVFEYNAFQYCGQLSEVVIGGNVTKKLPSGIFKECVSLSHIELPESLRSIGERAFQNCASLQHINLPPKLGALKDRCFADCITLKEIKLPKRVAVIPGSAFYNCKSLTTVQSSVNLIKIEANAFSYCTSLTNFEVYDQERDPEYEIYIDVDWEYDSFYNAPVDEIFKAALKDEPNWYEDDESDDADY